MTSQTSPRPRAGRPAKSDDRDVKGDILSAAVDLFAEGGFSKVSIKEITDKAGGSVGLVRHYFGSKDDLIAATNTYVIDELQEAFDKIGTNLDTKDGASLIDRLHERTVNVLAPRISLLFYLRQLVSEDPMAANGAFRAYFLMLQGYLNSLEAAGALADDVNRVWLTFQLMFVQLGPIFLAEQIEAIIGRNAYDPDIIQARGRESNRLFKAMLKPVPKP